MRVEKLVLRNFRNVQDCTLDPSSGLNCLIGSNGQGKTSIIEALGFLSTLRSFRGSKVDEVILWGQQDAEILCTITPDEQKPEHWRTELKVIFKMLDTARKKATKVAFINGKPYPSSVQFLRQRFGQFELGFHSIVFNPSDHDLVRGEPSVRRSYLDRVISAEDITYVETLNKYQRVLIQRNALLRSEGIPDRTVLGGFTEPLVQYGAAIVLKRLEWIERLSFFLSNASRNIAPNQLPLRLFYISNWVPEINEISISNNNLGNLHFSGQRTLPSLEVLERAFWNRLTDLEEAELRSRHSLVGPHRDDWSFFIGEQVLKGHGSQGEVRSALLALKLSEIDLFRNRTGHRPLLLLDDFSSELDRERRSFLLKYLSGTDLQVFVTTTEDFAFNGQRFWVNQGTLQKMPEGQLKQQLEA